MNPSQGTGYTGDTDLYEELLAAVGEPTRARDEQKLTVPTARRRSWLMRRMLLLADVLGLSGGFLAAAAIFASTGPVDRVSMGAEFLPFFRVPTVFIEVYDCIDSPTLTGRLCYRLADRFLLQWTEQQRFYPRGVVIGPLLP